MGTLEKIECSHAKCQTIFEKRIHYDIIMLSPEKKNILSVYSSGTEKRCTHRFCNSSSNSTCKIIYMKCDSTAELLR